LLLIFWESDFLSKEQEQEQECLSLQIFSPKYNVAGPCRLVAAPLGLLFQLQTAGAYPVGYPLFLIKLLIHCGLPQLLPGLQRLADGGGAFLHYYGDRILGLPLDELREVLALREPAAPGVIDLALGVPHFDLVPSSSTKLPADRRDLPPAWGLAELQVAVADKLSADHGLAIHPSEEVLVTAGVSGAFHIVLDALLNRGDRVVLFDPTSPLYHFALRQRGMRPRWVPTWMDDGRTAFDVLHLVEALRGARMLVVTSPANPTGGMLLPEDLEQIAWWAHRRDVLIFNDAAFERYRYEDGPPLSIASLPRAWQRTLTAGSVSKGHALAAARLGWLVGYRHLVRPCALTAALQTALMPTLCQQIALTALRQPAHTFAPIRNEFDSRRHYAFERLQAMGLQPDWPAGGFFFWLPVQELGLSGRAFAERLLRSRQVLVWPGHLFGPSGSGHIRISYALEDGRLREGLTRLADFLRELRATPQMEQWRRAA